MIIKIQLFLLYEEGVTYIYLMNNRLFSFITDLVILHC